MKTVVLQTYTVALFDAAVAQAAQLLRAGEMVALPTETVYGLAANALAANAVSGIFEVKDRPARNPIIVHVASLAMARRCASRWPSAADELAAAFWPGPLTLVLPRASEIPDIVTAGGPTVGIRWPSHPLIQAVIAACGFPLAAPSANPASQLSPTTAEHVLKYFDGRIPLIVDGGAAHVGIESSVVDLASEPPRLLRPGMARVESFLSNLGKGEGRAEQIDKTSAKEAILRSPGMLQKHYSPRAKLRVLSWRDETDLVSQVARFKIAANKVHIVAHDRIPLRCSFGRVAIVPHDAEAFARALYAELHRCDEEGAELIVVEAPPADESWQAIADRLKRASA